jgi:hypothetical protein
MEDKKIRSALEIAMERAASLPDLTQQELAEQKQREYQPRGAAIARRYLEGALKERDLQTELSKYRGQEGEIVKRAFLLTLNQSIKLESKTMSLKALEGIKTVEPTAGFDEMKQQIEAIFDEFNQQLEQEIPRYEALENERLEQLGISGSAVKPNLEESQTWQAELKRIQSEYDSRISKLKENLLPD